MGKNAPSSVDEYISTFPIEVQIILQKVRKTIKDAAPEAEETISYQMPAYKLNGILVYFAGYEKHIGFYPTPSGTENFKKEITFYKNAKGSVQFPIDKEIPHQLISEIVKFRVIENLSKKQKTVKKKISKNP